MEEGLEILGSPARADPPVPSALSNYYISFFKMKVERDILEGRI